MWDALNFKIMELYCAPCVSHGLSFKRINAKKPPTISEIIIAASAYLGVSEDMICGTKRFRYLVDYRHMIISYLRLDKKFKLKQIGRVVGKDHTTVINSVRSVKNMCETDDEYRITYHNLVTFLNEYEK